MLLINFFSSTAASRLTVYMYFLPMMIYPALVINSANQPRVETMVMVIAYHVLVLLIWFAVGNVSAAYIPYQNLLFDDV